MFKIFHQFRLAHELKAQRYQRAQAKSVSERRGMVSIAVIDDSPFTPKNNLEALGYKISLLGDPRRLDVLKEHHIILCDLQGVGQALGSETQGAFLIKEIRETFPEKYVVAYTGGALNQIITREAMQASDVFLKKDADIETWVETLDSIIQKTLDPYQVWQRQREALVSNEVDTRTLLELEDKFVRSITAGTVGAKRRFSSYIESRKISEDARAVVRSLVASGLFRLLVG